MQPHPTRLQGLAAPAAQLLHPKGQIRARTRPSLPPGGQQGKGAVEQQRMQGIGPPLPPRRRRQGRPRHHLPLPAIEPPDNFVALPQANQAAGGIKRLQLRLRLQALGQRRHPHRGRLRTQGGHPADRRRSPIRPPAPLAILDANLGKGIGRARGQAQGHAPPLPDLNRTHKTQAAEADPPRLGKAPQKTLQRQAGIGKPENHLPALNQVVPQIRLVIDVNRLRPRLRGALPPLPRRRLIRPAQGAQARQRLLPAELPSLDPPIQRPRLLIQPPPLGGPALRPPAPAGGRH
ncbi:MAG: hypothetical protein M2R46_04543 [Verrucomicrobia subdivision 3 bacterium]|nr:hypothetical protein [Limisphaerales bacterium]